LCVSVLLVKFICMFFVLFVQNNQGQKDITSADEKKKGGGGGGGGGGGLLQIWRNLLNSPNFETLTARKVLTRTSLIFTRGYLDNIHTG